jgi:hypothetical protein
MKKIILTTSIAIIAILMGYLIFIHNFELLPSNRIELIDLEINGSRYKIYSFEGNATTSSNLQLYKNDIISRVYETRKFYEQAKILSISDSTIYLLLGKGLSSFDTITVEFTEPDRSKK